MQVDHATYQAALTLYRNNRFDETLRVLEPFLRDASVHSEALNLAAICALNLGRNDEAKAYWRRVLDANPNDAGAYSNLGNLLSRLGEYEDALTAYRQALSIEPASSDYQLNLALLFVRQERWSEADLELRRTLVLREDFARAHFFRGKVMEAMNRPDKALTCYARAAALAPEDTPTYLELGRVAIQLNRWHEAEAAYRELASRLPDEAGVQFKLGLALEQQYQLGDAQACYLKAIALRPDLFEPHNNLGNLYLKRQDFALAKDALSTALQLRPDDATIHCNLAHVLVSLGERDEGETLYRKALEIDPDHANTKFHLSMLLLSSGRYEEGWRLHEARLDARYPFQNIALPALTYPDWQGESLDGRAIVVIAEQGLGDGIQFSRYFRLLKRRGAATVMVVCQQALVRLFENMDAVSGFIGPGQLSELPAQDFWCFSMSLPLRFGTTLETIPCEMPYLRPLDEDVRTWGARLPEVGPRVGLVWAGDPRPWDLDCNAVDRRRSVSARTYLPLLQIPGITFISLQKGDASEAELAALPDHLRPFDPMPQVTDFADTAAIVASLDLVITVDTSVAHLAGAMNKPTWILSRFDACWRWPRGQEDSPWYPSARVFGQSAPGDWEEVIETVAIELRKWAAKVTVNQI